MILRRGQVNVVLVVMVIALVLLVFVPLLASMIAVVSTRLSQYYSAIRTQVGELGSVLTGSINITAFLDNSGVLTLALRSTETQGIDLDKLLAVLNISGHVLTADILPYMVFPAPYYGIVNLTSFVYNASVSVFGATPSSWSLLSLIAVTKSGSTVPVKLYTATMINQLRTYLNTPSATRTYQPLPLSPSVVDPSDTASILSSGISIGRWISGTPPRIELLSSTQARQLIGLPTPTSSVAGVKGIGGYTTLSIESSSYVLEAEYSNVYIEADNLVIGNLYMLYDPHGLSLVNIMFSWDGGYIWSWRTQYLLYVNSSPVDLLSMCRYGYRVKILQFDTSAGYIALNGNPVAPSQNIAEYFYNYDPNHYVFRYLSLRGHARKVLIYCREFGVPETSYDPYILLGTTYPGYGYGILIGFEDVYYGDSTSDNDVVAGYLQEDVSTEPLVLVFRNLSISNSQASAVIVSLNYRFHDNEGEDFGGVTVDKPIIVVGLMDSSTGYVIAYRSLTFRELTRYEDTYPPIAEAQSVSVFIPLPPPSLVGSKTYYPFVAIQDPYAVNITNGEIVNDLDFALYLASVSILLYSG